MFRSGYPNTASYRAAGKADRLLRAAVTSFCSIARPTRREIAQLDDLAAPLVAGASEETLRFVAAALSETSFAPPSLVRRLSDLPVEISAPLLMRSPILMPIDLLALIGRRGSAHARAIAARPGLDERLMRLIASLAIGPNEPMPASAEEARDRLRAMMLPAQQTPPEAAPAPEEEPAPASPVRLRWEGKPGAYRKLRSTALTGAPALFRTALADALGIPHDHARDIAEDADPARLIVALRALSLSEEEAFLVMQCLRPARDRRAISAYLDAWQSVSEEDARRVASTWRAPSPHGSPANGEGRALRAS